MMRTRIFVYGTLKRGGRLHEHLAGQRFVADARTVPCYRLFRIDWFPGMVEHSAGVEIDGEIWDVDEPTLALLDQIEEFDVGLFERRSVMLSAPFNLDHIQAWFFLGDVTSAEDCGRRWS